MYEIGRPGAYVNSRKWKSRLHGGLSAVGAGLLGIAVPAALFGVVTISAAPVRALVAAAGVGAALGCALLWRRANALLVQSRREAAGVRAERDVRQALRRSGAAAVAYGLVLGRRGGDCDVVVITGQGGAVAIEVKYGNGPVSVEGETLRAGNRRLRSSPTRQAAGQANRLSRKLGGKPVLPVVCIPGMTNRPFQTDTGVWICSGRDLPHVFTRAPRVFDAPAEAIQILDGLRQPA